MQAGTIWSAYPAVGRLQYAGISNETAPDQFRDRFISHSDRAKVIHFIVPPVIVGVRRIGIFGTGSVGRLHIFC